MLKLNILLFFSLQCSNYGVMFPIFFLLRFGRQSTRLFRSNPGRQQSSTAVYLEVSRSQCAIHLRVRFARGRRQEQWLWKARSVLHDFVHPSESFRRMFSFLRLLPLPKFATQHTFSLKKETPIREFRKSLKCVTHVSTLRYQFFHCDQKLLLSFLKNQLSSCVALGSAKEYYHWLTTYIRYLSQAGKSLVCLLSRLWNPGREQKIMLLFLLFRF